MKEVGIRQLAVTASMLSNKAMPQFNKAAAYQGAVSSLRQVSAKQRP
jgi:hypothetical protein